MKNKFLPTLLALGMSVWMACSQETEENQLLVSENAEAKIEFISTEHDFGEIPQNIPAVYSFKFTNPGNEPLILSNVKGSCQCMVPEWPKEPILPGKSAEIKAKFSAKNPGKFRKSITVTSNTSPSTNVLYISGVVKKEGE